MGGILKFLATMMVCCAFLTAQAQPASASETITYLPTTECRQLGNNLSSTSLRFEDSGHVENWSQSIKPLGEVKALFIAQDFDDVPAKTKFEDMEKFAASISDEFRRLSFGRFNLKITPLDGWLRMPKTAQHYSSTSDWGEKIRDALRLADSRVNLKEFDMFIIKTDEKNKVITPASALPLLRTPDNQKIFHGVYLGNDGWTQMGRGLPVAVHEIMHLFATPDLYMGNPDGTNPVGIYDLMSGGNDMYPGQVLGWNRWRFGWIEDREVSCLDSSRLQQIQIDPAEQKNRPIVLPINTQKVLVVEPWKPFTTQKASKIIAYTVETKKFVAVSEGEWGKVSPIQVLTPVGVRRSKDWGAFNLDLAVNPGQKVNTEIGVVSLVKGGEILTVRFEPSTSFENTVNIPKLDTTKISIGEISPTNSNSFRKILGTAIRTIDKYPAQSVTCVATAPRASTRAALTSLRKIAGNICTQLKAGNQHLEVNALVQISKESRRSFLTLSIRH